MGQQARSTMPLESWLPNVPARESCRMSLPHACLAGQSFHMSLPHASLSGQFSLVSLAPDARLMPLTRASMAGQFCLPASWSPKR